jgi:hypothetical protein
MQREPNPFEERRALAELEQFRRDIERYRRQREAVGQQFDAFLDSLPKPEDVFPAETSGKSAAAPSTAATPAPIPLPPLPARPSTHPPARPTSPPLSPSSAALGPMPMDLDTADAMAAALESSAPRRGRSRLLAVVLLLVAIGAFAAWMLRRGEGTASPQTASTPAPQAAPQAAPQPATPPPAAPAASVESEITTLRRAWVRVIADGERVVERELPANTRIPFKADKTIVIRTGDAGAVKLSIRGEDQGAMGRDGQVVTRTFTVPGTSAR